jgi:iron complex transport system ATP-binding protein
MSTVGLHINDLKVGFREKELFSIDQFHIHHGQLTALIGRNGMGKSTLLKMLGGLIEVEKNKIFLHEKDISLFTPIDLAKELAFVFNNRMTPPSLSVQTTVEMGRFAHRDAHTELGQKHVVDAINALHLSPLRSSRIDVLSDGEFQKVSIARAIAQGTSVLVLDEPTAFLDYIAREELIQLLAHWVKEKNMAILFTSHDIELVEKYATKIWEIENQQLQCRR